MSTSGISTTPEDILEYIWYIKITSPDNTECVYKSGVGINDRTILTCYHGFESGVGMIQARRGKNRPFHRMNIDFSMPEPDLATLEFESRQVPTFPYLELSDNEVLDVGDPIAVAGHDGSHPTAIETKLSVVCACVCVDPKAFAKYDRFNRTPEEFPGPRPYPMLHDMMNSCTSFPAESYFNPKIPLIFMNDWGSHIFGRSGSPVYRPDRKIVGVCIGTNDNAFWAVHLSAVRDFLQRADAEKKSAKKLAGKKTKTSVK